MPAGQGKDAERFAAAVESGTPLGAAGDADLARELEIVAMLRSRGAAFAPDAETKARAKQRLMAVLAAEHAGPRPVAADPDAAELTAPLGRPIGREDVDPTAETTRMAPVTPGRPVERAEADDPAAHPAAGAGDDATAVEPIPLHGRRSGRRSRHSLAGRGVSRRSTAAGLRGRVVLVGAAAAAAVIAIAGGGVLASGDALPGDNLYPVKRVAESAGLALTFDDAERARRQLEIAATRLDEVERLAARDAGAEPAPEVYTQAMDEFEAATDEGSRLLLESAASEGSGTAEDDLRSWASEQSERLTELQPELPAAADAETSMALLERLLGRTGAEGTDAECAGEDCDARRGAEDGGSGSRSGDAAEDATTSTPDEDGSASETDEPSRTPDRTGEREDPKLLPDLGPDAGREDEEGPTGTREEDEDRTSTSEQESGDEGGEGGNVSVPLPLLPPVTLPPLLPGMPGITIG